MQMVACPCFLKYAYIHLRHGVTTAGVSRKSRSKSKSKAVNVVKDGLESRSKLVKCGSKPHLQATTPGSSAGVKDWGPPLAFSHSRTAHKRTAATVAAGTKSAGNNTQRCQEQQAQQRHGFDRRCTPQPPLQPNNRHATPLSPTKTHTHVCSHRPLTPAREG